MLFVVQVDIFFFSYQRSEMLVAVIVGDAEIGQRRYGISSGQINPRAVAEFDIGIELQSAKFFLVQTEIEQQGSSFIGVVAHAKAQHMGLGVRHVDA